MENMGLPKGKLLELYPKDVCVSKLDQTPKPSEDALGGSGGQKNTARTSEGTARKIQTVRNTAEQTPRSPANYKDAMK